MIKIGIVGAPSIGKTTLAEGISFHYKSQGSMKRVSLITEYAREFVKDFKTPTTADEKHILDKQIENEKMAQGASVMITDSPFWLSYIYACHFCKTFATPKDNYYINQIHSVIINRLYDYNVIIYLPFNNDFLEKTNIKDGQRIHEDLSEILKIDKKIIGFMNLHDINYEIIDVIDADARLKRSILLLDKIIKMDGVKNQITNG